MRSLVVACALVVAVGCQGMKQLGGRSGDELSYAQVQSIQPGLTATQVLDSFPSPGRMSRGPNGKVTELDYAAMDAKQGKARLVLGFDANEVLVSRRFTGAPLKP
jgi:hypothetical protein